MKPIEILSSFSFADTRITLKAIDTIYLPKFRGSALRGVFGHAFKKFACNFNTANDCHKCLLVKHCIYAYVFETTAPENDTFLRNNNAVAHPYIIYSPLSTRQIYHPGDEIIFNMILMGRAIQYFSYFVQTFIIMGDIGLGRGKGKFMLKHVDCQNEKGQQQLLYQAGDQKMRSSLFIRKGCDIFLKMQTVPDCCKLHFITRLEIKQKGKYPTITFGVFFRSLMRRIITLAHLHHGIDCSSLNFNKLCKAADKIITVSSNLKWDKAERYSNRQKKRMPFGGLTGEMVCKGNLKPFWPFLLLGQYLHVGKKASFGFGRYELL